MDKDRQAIGTHHRNDRVRTANSPDSVRLAEVETAVIASKQALIDEGATMRADGKYADGYIDNHIAQRKTQSVAYIDKLKKDIVDPIALKIESQAKATAFELPERMATHVEASAHYSALVSD